MSDFARLNHRLRLLLSPIRPTALSSFASQKSDPTTSISADISTQDQLKVLDQILTEIESSGAGSFAYVVPQAALQATDTLNPTQSTTTLKEVESALSADISPVEAAAGLQQIEHEPSPELPTEVESYLRKAESHQEKLAPEIVIADGSVQVSGAHQPAKKPVIVLPITAKQEEAGQKKSLRHSLRWLVEWSRKIIKMFTGKVIYRPEIAAK